jgi:ABC-type transport system involved in multi-copper enzyme maturation permease subunit
MNRDVVVETVRRHLTSVGYVSYGVLIALTGVLAATFNKPASMWPALVALLSIITGAAVIGPEFSTATLQLIVSRPIRRSVYLLSRVTGVLLSVAFAAIIGVTSEAVTRLLSGSGEVPWSALVPTFANSLLTSLLAIALLTLLGSVTRSYFNVAIYAGVNVSFSVTETLLGLVHTKATFSAELLATVTRVENAVMAVDDVLFPDAPLAATTGWYLRVAATIAAALALACLAFERREVPYGGD